MPSPTQPQVLAKIESTISAVADTGLILARERNIESDTELITLFRALNDGVLKGWLIKNAGFTQIREGASCDITRSLKYVIETIYPFEDKPISGVDSHGRFRLMTEAVNAAFNVQANWDLGLGWLVEHQLLQATEDFAVQKLGEGADTHLVHYASFELVVNVGITV
jgi:hypothetical protein